MSSLSSELESYYHIFTIGTIDGGISVYVYLATFTSLTDAIVYAEALNGTIFLWHNHFQNIREYDHIGFMNVDLYTKKNGWRVRYISERPLV